MQVREARESDVQTIVSFNRLLAEETEGRAPDRDVLTRGVERGLGRPELCRYWLAELGGAIAGQAMVTYEWSDWRDGMFWWLQSVYVVKEARGRGVFRALYTHIAESANADPGVCGLRLYVEAENEGARRVYQRLGMRETSYHVLEHDWSDAFG